MVINDYSANTISLLDVSSPVKESDIQRKATDVALNDCVYLKEKDILACPDYWKRKKVYFFNATTFESIGEIEIKEEGKLEFHNLYQLDASRCFIYDGKEIFIFNVETMQYQKFTNTLYFGDY